MSKQRLRGLNRAGVVILACAVIACTLLPATAHGQSGEKSEKTGRKLIYKVDPDYPWDLKRAHIGGVVRLRAIVTPRGTIDSVSVVGGNPILVDTAVRAVKKWKYAPANAETVVDVNVDFDPSH